MYYTRILAFMFPVLYSPNDPEHFLGFFTSWMRIRIPHIFMRIHADPDPKHCFRQFGGEAINISYGITFIVQLWCCKTILFRWQPRVEAGAGAWAEIRKEVEPVPKLSATEKNPCGERVGGFSRSNRKPDKFIYVLYTVHCTVGQIPRNNKRIRNIWHLYQLSSLRYTKCTRVLNVLC